MTLGEIQDGDAVAHLGIGLGNGRHRRAGRNVHTDDVAVLYGARDGAVTHVRKAEPIAEIDAEGVENVSAGLLGAGIAHAKHIALAVDIGEIVKGAAADEIGAQHEMLNVRPGRSDRAQMRLRRADRPAAFPGPGGEDAENQAELRLVVAQQLDVFHGAGGTDCRQ